jgi:hypothetical protein
MGIYFLVFLTILMGQINMNFTMLKIMLIVSVIYMLVISVMYKLVSITPTSTLPLVNWLFFWEHLWKYTPP